MLSTGTFTFVSLYFPYSGSVVTQFFGSLKCPSLPRRWWGLQYYGPSAAWPRYSGQLHAVFTWATGPLPLSLPSFHSPGILQILFYPVPLPPHHLLQGAFADISMVTITHTTQSHAPPVVSRHGLLGTWELERTLVWASPSLPVKQNLPNPGIQPCPSFPLPPSPLPHSYPFRPTLLRPDLPGLPC